MPEPVYQDTLTRESERRLAKLLSDLPSPVALAGGHAVRHRVGASWKARFGQDYFGSRDIDVAYWVDPSWSRDELAGSAIGQAPARLLDLGFHRSGAFRFSLFLDGEGKRVEHPRRFAIEGVDYHVLSVDVMATAHHADAKEVLGFVPIDEPLLAKAFQSGFGDSLKEYGNQVLLPITPLLIATKLRSLPERTKDDKRIKDICDLYALAAYGGASSQATRKIVHAILPEVARLVATALRHDDRPAALRLLDIQATDYEAIIGPLALPP